MRLAGLLVAATLLAVGCSKGEVATDDAPASMGPASVVQIALGLGGHPCWRRADGAVRCYGASAPPPGLEADVVDVAAGWLHYCARTADGRTLCWGNDDAGQLGPGADVGKVSTPVVVEPVDATFTAIAPGYGQTCALDGFGSVWCWGNGTPALRQVVVGGPAVEIVTGKQHACVRRRDGAVLCWSDGSTPTEVSGLSRPVQKLVAGDGFTCALLDDGSVACWTPTKTPQSDPAWFDGVWSAGPPLLPPVVDIAEGEHHVCAREASGAVWCWGDNASGQCGAPVVASGRDVPSRVQRLQPVSAIARGRDLSSCAVAQNGAMWCWGIVLEELCSSPTAPEDCTAIPQPLEGH